MAYFSRLKRQKSTFLSFPQPFKRSINPQFPQTYPQKSLTNKGNQNLTDEYLYIFVEKSHLGFALFHICGKPVLKTPGNTKLNLCSSHQISSEAEAFREVSANLPPRYSKQPATAIIAPLSPQSSLGGTINFTPLP